MVIGHHPRQQERDREGSSPINVLNLVRTTGPAFNPHAAGFVTPHHMHGVNQLAASRPPFAGPTGEGFLLPPNTHSFLGSRTNELCTSEPIRLILT